MRTAIAPFLPDEFEPAHCPIVTTGELPQQLPPGPLIILGELPAQVADQDVRAWSFRAWPRVHPTLFLPTNASSRAREFMLQPRSSVRGPRQLVAQAMSRAPRPLVNLAMLPVSFVVPRPLSPVLEKLETSETSDVALRLSTTASDRVALLGFSAHGDIRTVVKYGSGGETVAALEHEYGILNELRSVSELSGSVPNPRGMIDVRLGRALITDGKVGRPCPATLTPMLAEWLERCISDEEHDAATSPLVRDTGANLTEANAPDALVAATTSFVERLRHAAVPKTIVHGDFVPWNIVLSASGPNVFDWEFSTLAGLPEWDRLHFEIQLGLATRGWADEQLQRYLADAVTTPSRFYNAQELTALVGLLCAQLWLKQRNKAVTGAPLAAAALALNR